MNRSKFFSGYRSSLDKNRRLSQKEVDALDNFLDMYESESRVSRLTIQQWAYIFATVFHETAYTFLPVREAYWLSEEWRKKNLRYYPYYGRGFVQLTWKDNYKLFSDIYKEDFVSDPDLVMEPRYAFDILVKGCEEGLFTGKSLSDYIGCLKKESLYMQFKKARRVINGTDKDSLIANYAMSFFDLILYSK